MKRTLIVLTLAALFHGCASAPATDEPHDAPRPVARGINVEPYAGTFSGYRPLEDALANLDVDLEEALRRMEVRLGIAPDPDRPRIVRISDEEETWTAETSLIGGRSVQVIVLPAAPLAQGRAVLSDLLLEALTHAALTDTRLEVLPGWFRGGAPRWISGGMERALVERVLSVASLPVSDDAVLPGFDPLRGESDPLSGSFFLAWMAETFGPEVLPEMVRALSSAETIEAALEAVLPHDPSSLEAGFDTYRIVRVGKLAEDPTVIELLDVRSLPPAEQLVRLSGLGSRAPHPMIGAAAAEQLGLAQYETGDFVGASETLARVEREYLKDALHADRDGFLFAMCFARQQEDSAAAFRLENFLVEFPGSPYTAEALFELAGVMQRLERNADAMSRLRELCERYPLSEYADNAYLELGKSYAARHRYAEAVTFLERALPDPAARSALDELAAATAGGLPAAGEPAVRQALRELASPDDETGRAGIEALREIGPLAGPIVSVAAANPPARWFDGRVIEAVMSWGLPAATPVLSVMLARPERPVVSQAMSALADLGASAGQIRRILDDLPAGSGTAESAWLDRFGGKTGVPEVAGMIDDADFRQRMEAARILSAIDTVEAIAALRTLLDDESPAVRRSAAIALSGHPEPAARLALALALDDEAVTVRLAAVESLARVSEYAPIRDRALTDQEPAVRLAAAAQLLAAGDDVDYPRVVALLSEPEGGVAAGVENLLRDRQGEAYEGALVDALVNAPDDGTAMRVARLMCRRLDQDLGYDPGGGAEERERVAALFVSLLEES